jgi:hypothetical protein
MQKKVLFKSLALALLVLSSCKKEDNPVGITPPNNENTPQNNFNVMWADFDQNYPVFDVDCVNWDSLYFAYYPKISSGTTDQELFNIMKSCILDLKDAHSDLVSQTYGSCDYYNIFSSQKPTNFVSWYVISSKYIQILKSNNQNLAYGRVPNQNIGYFFISSFMDSTSDYYFIDSLLTALTNPKGLIIDVRQNSGGDSRKGEIVAGRLTNTVRTYEYIKRRNGPKHSDLTNFIPVLLYPRGSSAYMGKVVLLTNRRTFSAAENFTLMLRSLPQVTQIGDTTGGGVATDPVYKPLPNGWQYRVPISCLYDLSQTPIKGGIPPQISVQISRADSVMGVDKILEEAISKINEQ